MTQYDFSMPAFISPDLWPQNSPYINPVDCYKICQNVNF